MNRGHVTYLSSPDWAARLQADLLPWLRDAADLGDDVLEIGPGPGLTTDLLLGLTKRITAVEIDPVLAGDLRIRLRDFPVDVINADARTADLPSARFSAATCFTMLHHMESPAAQDELFVRLHTLLRPGAPLLGVDTVDSETMRDHHVDDVFVPVDPEALPHRLRASGFVDVTVTRPSEDQFRFTARKP